MHIEPIIKITIQLRLENALFKSIVLQLYKMSKNDKKKYNIFLNSKKIKITNNMTIFKYKNILQAK